MASKSASRLKLKWTELPDECFDPLTFGELKVGEKFICLPVPGDNHGHGGFKGAHYIFTKTHSESTEGGCLVPEYRGQGRAVNNRGISSIDPDSMWVVLVE